MTHDPDCQFNIMARVILAKRGDREALQFYACKSRTDRAEVMGALLKEDLQRIGGDFAVEIYRRLLDDADQRFPIHDDPSSDMLLTPFSDSVPSSLRKLLPDAPIPTLTPLQFQANSEARERVKSLWRLWIDTHQAELQQMKPTSEGIGFDADSCSGIVDISSLQRRLEAIAGPGGLVCGPASYDSDATLKTKKCVKRAFGSGKGFYAWYVLGGGVVYETAIGVAGDAKGNVFMLSFDDAGASHAGLGDDVEVVDNGNTVVARCPKPIRFGEGYSRNLTCITQAGNIRLSPSTIH